MRDNFYNHLTDDEKQLCDLCRDWNLGDCERCDFVSHYLHNNKEDEILNIVLYTIDCPKCVVLEKKLKQKNISFVKVSDKNILIAKGFGNSTFPLLEVGGAVMSYKTATEWINEQ